MKSNDTPAGSAAGIDLDKIKVRRMFTSSFFDGLNQEIALAAADKDLLGKKADLLLDVEKLDDKRIYEVAILPAAEYDALIALARATPQPSADRAPADGAGELAVDIEILHTLLDQMRGAHGTAIGVAYCPSSEPFKAAQKRFNAAYDNLYRTIEALRARAPTAGDSATPQPGTLLQRMRALAKYGDQPLNVLIQEAADEIERLSATPQHSVAEQADVSASIHYPECWDTAAYPTLADALRTIGAFKCSECARPLASTAATQPEQADDYKLIAQLIGIIFFAGDFKAETFNERQLEALLVKTGHRYASWAEIDALAIQASTARIQPKGGE